MFKVIYFTTCLARIVGIVEPFGHGQLRSGRQAAVDDGTLDAQLLEAARHGVDVLKRKIFQVQEQKNKTIYYF